MENKKIKVSIVENETFLSEVIAELINQTNSAECSSIFNTGEDALLYLLEDAPDVVLMDIHLGSAMNGVECMYQLKKKSPQLKFLVLTVYENHTHVFDALSAGALGYILKSASPEKIVSAIEEVYEGGAPMSPSIARMVVNSFNNELVIVKSSDEAHLLTAREREIIELIAKGLLEKEVANELSISDKTVKTHIKNIYSKLHVNTRVEALNKYFGRYS